MLVRLYVSLERMGPIVTNAVWRIIALEGPPPPAVLTGAILCLEPPQPLIASALPTLPCFHPCAIVLLDSFGSPTQHPPLAGGVILVARTSTVCKASARALTAAAVWLDSMWHPRARPVLILSVQHA